MRIAMPPSAVRVTVTPGNRVISSSSMGSAGERPMSSEVTTGAAGAPACAALPRPWVHAAIHPTSSAAGTTRHGVAVMGLLVRPFCLDDDHAVRTAHPVERRAGFILEHFDRRDVLRIEPVQRAVRTRFDRDTVDHEERLLGEPERAWTADEHRDA